MRIPMDIEGKVAFITGTRRIGRLVGLALGQKGARVALGYHRSRESAEQAARELRDAGRQAMPVQADLNRQEEISDAVKRIAAVWGGVDVLVNLASVYASKPFEETTEHDWDLNMNVNLRSAFLCARAVIPGMKARGGGRIINCADWTAASGRPRYKGYLPYYVSKVGVVGLTEALALELAPYNILVNAVAPGPMVPPPDLTPEAVEKVRQVTPLGRWGGGEQIALAVIGLIDSDFITGECIRVDGGRHIL
ncbi:MAG: SDR family oxidoreductase [Acidobacteria bacterium]|nr:SDR family oxidoreductase [Acidobacteriota bacterium]